MSIFLAAFIITGTTHTIIVIADMKVAVRHTAEIMEEDDEQFKMFLRSFDYGIARGRREYFSGGS
jgi:D-serine deaminase-like pyridoxal phosphate-dependent protein